MNQFGDYEKGREGMQGKGFVGGCEETENDMENDAGMSWFQKD